MSEKRHTAAETANGTPANAGKGQNTNKTAEGGVEGIVKAVKAEAEASGIEWDETNTEPAVKTFRIDFRLDIDDRLKLGILAARCNLSPERYLQDQLRARFIEVTDKVFCGNGNRSEMDKASVRTYEALIVAAYACSTGKGRLAIRPAVMA